MKQMITSELALSKRDVRPNHGFFDDLEEQGVQKSGSPDTQLEKDVTQKSALRVQPPVQEHDEEKTQTLLSHS